MKHYPNLFSPLKVNSQVLKNPIIAAPMGGGFVNTHKLEFLAAKARGGASLVILGSCNFYGIVYDDKLIGDFVSPRKVEDATYEGYFAITSLV